MIPEQSAITVVLDELTALQAENEKLRSDLDAERAISAEHNTKWLRLSAENEKLRATKDNAYEERNRVVAALASLFPSGIKRTNIEGWDDEWHGCVYIDIPTGQVSWHYHDSQAHLFSHLPAYDGEWDGHDTPEKYRRLAAIAELEGK